MEALKIDYDGRTFNLDLAAVSSNEWKHVRQYTGLNPFDVLEGLTKSIIECVEAVYWLTMRQATEPNLGNIGTKDFSIFGFLEGWKKADEAVAKAEKAKANAEETDPKAPAQSSSTDDSLSG